MGYFDERLMQLLPQVYRLEDNGDLRDFLRVFAPTLDWLKARIDDFPVLWDLDRVPADFLPVLGALVGYPYNPQRDAEVQRRLLRFRIEFYRRKGTRYSLQRILHESGVEGEVFENEPWEGCYRIRVDEPPLWLAPLLEEVHPAGTKWVFHCVRVCLATVSPPQTRLARMAILPATATAAAQGFCVLTETPI